ncbi:MAG TPA: hypothetical protein PKM43_00830 [Verrucomicrobiota bacterium]|nr:hypothetical protein [Verrucomicrobiota bacterium]HRZ34992.1 hypothetical protein [Candidatus Paceibacterota bacterium]HRZ53931.1 hypothetical protein [Candidatus Paceibacterota bacterium]
MKAFAQLIETVRATPSSSGKVAALADYFCRAEPADAAWALALLNRRRSRQLVEPALLRLWAAEAAAIPLWLIDECHQVAGDLGETLALILPPVAGLNTAPRVPVGESSPDPQGPCPPAHGGSAESALSLRQLIENRLLPLSGLDTAAQHDLVLATWAELGTRQRLLWNRLLTGTFRIGVSRAMLARALARQTSIDPAILEYRMMSGWEPRAEDFRRLVSPETTLDDAARPYPFHPLAEPDEAASAQPPAPDCQVEWDWIGQRLQVIRRRGHTILWSEPKGILTDALPGLAQAASLLPDGTVLEGVLSPRHGGGGPAEPPASASPLLRELARRRTATHPLLFIARDLLESRGVDWRIRPLTKRREELERLFGSTVSAWGDAQRQSQKRSFEQGELFENSAIFSRSRANCTRTPNPSRPPPCPLQLSTLVPVAGSEWSAMRLESVCPPGAAGLLFRRLDSVYGGCRREDAWQRVPLSRAKSSADTAR